VPETYYVFDLKNTKGPGRFVFFRALLNEFDAIYQRRGRDYLRATTVAPPVIP